MSLCRAYLDDWHAPRSCTTITLDGLELYGTDPGFGYGVERFDGWVNGVDFAGGPVPYEAADGGLMGQIVRRGRLIVIEGVVQARDGGDLQRRMEKLGAVLSGERSGDLVVREEWLGVQRMVREVTRLRAPQITPETLTEAIFTLELASPHSVRVAALESVLTLQPGKSGTATNAGNLPAEATLILRGPLANPSITIAGQQWRYEGSVSSGKSLRVDLARRDVRDPATNTGSRRQAFGAWPTIPPGASAVTAGGTGQGTSELHWRSTWS
ncbi:hypothetical protein M3G03_10000 [Aestuariimicrobium sp. p3-SID1156]|uniref:hypothetical protein n=1 Tax=Aestuariimicrobium sp. p3-SID1156 TaxID=2916038 RepID=UPI00223BCC37|nr:hypothetical protein [Aestuariimicrobium sp. p3-SID1156]MCT1459862.1 hypothetical protein [Aestuariimicrobium sp. p3-SID1156]